MADLVAEDVCKSGRKVLWMLWDEIGKVINVGTIAEGWLELPANGDGGSDLLRISHKELHAAGSSGPFAMRDVGILGGTGIEVPIATGAGSCENVGRC